MGVAEEATQPIAQAKADHVQIIEDWDAVAVEQIDIDEDIVQSTTLEIYTGISDR